MLAVLGLVWVVNVMGSSYYDNHPLQEKVQFMYTFQEGLLDPDTTSTADISGKNVLGSLILDQASWKGDRSGLVFNGTAGASIGASSEFNMTDLVPVLGDGTNFTIEMYIEKYSDSGYVWGFSDFDSDGATPDCFLATQSDDAMLSTADGFVMETSDSSSCVRCSQSVGTGLNHIVMTHGVWDREIYLNNIFEASCNNRFRFGFTETRKLQLGAIFSDAEGWSGHIAMFAMYDSTLTVEEVTTLYEYGMPNNIPAVTDVVFSCPEDNPVRGYLTGSPSEAATTRVSISLKDYCSDADGDNLTIYITSLPSRGTLFSCNSESMSTCNPIDEASYPDSLVELSGDAWVVYQGELNGFGDNYANFTYLVHHFFFTRLSLLVMCMFCSGTRSRRCRLRESAGNGDSRCICSQRPAHWLRIYSICHLESIQYPVFGW